MTRWNHCTDPLYRWLLAESADLEWHCVEDEFQAALKHATAGSVPAIDEARDAIPGALKQ